jgi:hypothetical protein
VNISDHISESLETIFGLEMLKFFDADPVPGSGIRDLVIPGSGIRDGKIGSGNNIPDPQHWSNANVSSRCTDLVSQFPWNRLEIKMAKIILYRNHLFILEPYRYLPTVCEERVTIRYPLLHTIPYMTKFFLCDAQK